MSEDEQMLYCLIAFILGWLVSRHMGNGFSVGGSQSRREFDPEKFPNWPWMWGETPGNYVVDFNPAKIPCYSDLDCTGAPNSPAILKYKGKIHHYVYPKCMRYAASHHCNFKVMTPEEHDALPKDELAKETPKPTP